MPFMEVECSREVTGIFFFFVEGEGRTVDMRKENRSSVRSILIPQGRPVGEWHSCDFAR